MKVENTVSGRGPTQAGLRQEMDRMRDRQQQKPSLLSTVISRVGIYANNKIAGGIIWGDKAQARSGDVAWRRRIARRFHPRNLVLKT